MTAILIEAALRGAAFAAVVGLGLTVLRVKNVPARKAAWILVLAASSAMPLLMRWPSAAGLPSGFGWSLPASLSIAAPPLAVQPSSPPILSLPFIQDDRQPAREAVKWAIAADPEPGSAAPSPDLAAAPPATHRPQTARRKWTASDLRQLAPYLYLAVAGLLLLRLLIGAAAALHLWITAQEISPLDVPQEGVRASARITSPVTVGSGVVLPAGYTQWSREKLRMVIAHEKSHVRQMDFWLQLLAGFYTAIFWFSPLGWWLRRNLAALGEAISDRAGMHAAASGPAYAQVVLEFASMPRRRLPGVAMARSANLSQRVERMLNEGVFHAAFAEGRLRGLVSLLLVPAALFAATALIRAPHANAQTLPASAPAAQQPSPAPAIQKPSAAVSQPNPKPAPPATGEAFPGRAESQVMTTQAPQEPLPAAALPASPAAPPVPPVPQVPLALQIPIIPTAPVLPQVPIGAAVLPSNSLHLSSNGDCWAIIHGSDIHSFSGVLSQNAREAIARARSMDHGTFLWFMHDGKSYIVDDPSAVAQIQSLDRQMAGLGRQQSLLGQTQANLSAEQMALDSARIDIRSVQLPDMQKIMAQAEAAMKSAQTQWNAQMQKQFQADMQAAQAELSPEKMAAMQDQLRAAQAQLSPDRMAALDAQLKAAQSELSPEKMAAMQAKLKAEQQRWNAQSMAAMQARLAETQAKLARMQAELQAKQAESNGRFAEKMAELGRKQAEMGAAQGRLGSKQGQLAEQLNRTVEQIIRQALEKGTAKPIR